MRKTFTSSLPAVARVMIMLLAALLLVMPIAWLLVAPTKTDAQLRGQNPYSFGSLAAVGRAWSNLLSFNDGQFLTWLSNTVFYALATTALSMLLCVPAGYAFAMYVFRGRKALLTVTMISMIVPVTALILPLFLELAWLGMTNTAWSVILPGAFFPFGVWLSYLYFRSSLPVSLIEAARLDGCSETRIFWSLGLPLGRPVLGIVGFFSFVGAWNNYFLPYVMLSENSKYNLQVGLQTLVSSTPAVNPSRAATGLPILAPEVALAAVVTVLPVLAVFVFAQRYLVAGQVSGAIKG